MVKKRTPVTSVTPKSTVKPVSKAQQARTRKLIAGIASVTPVGRAAKAVTTTAKTTKVVKTLAEPKSAVRVIYNKQAMENAIKDGQFKMKRPDMSPSRPAKSAPSRPNLVKIDSSIKTKTIKTKTNTRALKAANKKKSK